MLGSSVLVASTNTRHTLDLVEANELLWVSDAPSDAANATNMPFMRAIVEQFDVDAGFLHHNDHNIRAS